MQALYSYIKNTMPFSDHSWGTLISALQTVTIRKNDDLLQKGIVCNAIYFISKGYCRTFQYLDGNEINTDFHFENDFVTNISSLRQNSPSEYTIQACEPCTVIKIDKHKLLDAYKLAPEIESFGRQVLELIVIKQEEHSAIFKLLTAQQRYEQLQKMNPQILQRISLTQLSSYLGVSRETLSRIRNKIKTG
ncbi:MAG: Crp/Fnr family transcriptional regulator [Daejeonella sp.]|nr:Crp/Fnr family transcriptional regulator [Daejeonella sp.]